MAEYYAVLSRAIAGLTSASPETRRAVYDKARNALIGQLRAIAPPLPTAEISRQRLELEEAIRRVEREISTGILPPAPPRPQIQAVPPPPPRQAPPPPAAADSPSVAAEAPGRRSPQDIFRRAILDAESRAAPSPPASADRAPRSLTARPVAAAQRSPANAKAATARAPKVEEDHDEALDPAVTDDITPDMEEGAPPLAAEPAMPLPPNTRNLRPSARPGEARLPPDYAVDPEGEPPPPPRSVRPPPERSREVRLGPAPIDPRIDDVAPPKRARRGDVPEDVAMSEPKRRRSRVPLIIAAVVVILAGGAAYAGWTQWTRVSGIIASLGKPAAQPPVGGSATIAVPVAPTPTPKPATAPVDSTKNGDRLLPSGQTVPGPTPVAPLVPPVAAPSGNAPRVVGSDAGITPPPGSTPTSPGVTRPAAGTGPQASLTTPPTTSGPSTPAGPPVPQKATLYEEPTDPSLAATSTLAIAGTVTWSFITGPTDGPEVVGIITIPDRKLTVRLTIHRNMDTSLPASHLVEFMVSTAADFPGKGVQTVQTMVLKPSEDARGDVLIGASATVATGYYWIALSNAQKDLTTNTGLLRDREWLDIRLVYQSGQRAILTLEKGPSGDQVFAKALSAWQTG